MPTDNLALFCAENRTLAEEIFLKVYPGRKCYEGDVPDKFVRPCFLFLNPEHGVQVTVINPYISRIRGQFTVYAFIQEEEQARKDGIDIIDEITKIQRSILEYSAGAVKYKIPDSDNRYITIERADAEPQPERSVVQFTFNVLRYENRALRRPPVVPINEVQISVTVRDADSESTVNHTRKGE